MLLLFFRFNVEVSSESATGPDWDTISGSTHIQAILCTQSKFRNHGQTLFPPVNSIYYTVWPSHKNINNQPRSKPVLMSDYMDLHRTSYQAFTPELQSCRHLATVLLTRKCTLTAEERSNKKVSRLRKTFSTMLSVSVPTSISLSVDVNMKASRCSRLIEVCSSQASTWRSFFHRILKKNKNL